MPKVSSLHRSTIKRNLGYLFIWGDVYRVFFGIHALAVGPVDVEQHLRVYLLVFMPIIDWASSLSPLVAGFWTVLFGLPAAAVYFGGFALSTSIGLWLVRTSGASLDAGE